MLAAVGGIMVLFSFLNLANGFTLEALLWFIVGIVLIVPHAFKFVIVERFNGDKGKRSSK